MSESSRPAMRVRRLRAEDADIPLPHYATNGAAGMDLPAAVSSPVTLAPGERRLIPTGLAIELPRAHEGQVRPRSGLAVRHGISMVNAPGTIDEDYRGEVKVILINLGQEPFVVERGMRIAQLVVMPVTQVHIEEVDDLSDTLRSGGGFGHTGTK